MNIINLDNKIINILLKMNDETNNILMMKKEIDVKVRMNSLKSSLLGGVLWLIQHKKNKKYRYMIYPFTKNVIDETLKDFIENDILSIKYVNLDKNNNPNSVDLEWKNDELLLDYLIKNLK